MNKTGVILGTLGALIVGFLVGQRVHLDKDTDTRPVPTAAPDSSVERYKIQVGNAPVTGSPTAKVTIVEFSDYQCPFCSRVEPTLEKLKRSYGKDLRVTVPSQSVAVSSECRTSSAGRDGRTRAG